MTYLEIKNLNVEVEKKKILKGINLKLDLGKVHVIMGPNGSGKSTLANVLMGNPKYKVTSGKILLNKKNILKLSPNQRAKKGLFMSFQNPVAVSGVTVSSFLKQTHDSKEDGVSLWEFADLIDEKREQLGLDEKFMSRYLNVGFSGGEKKKAEILQMLVLDPTFAILDETDSGLDIDSLKTVAKGISKFMNRKKGALIITHYQRILNYIKPDQVSIMIDGKIVKQGSSKLIKEIEKKGYSSFKE